MAETIVFLNRKGGPGKTTLAMNVAAQLAGLHRVLLIDADPQQSATKWFNSATDTQPFPVSVVGYSQDRINLTIKKFVDDYRYILVDTPPSALAENTVTRSALFVADLAVIPVVPSPLDLWEALEIKNLLEDVNAVRESSIDIPALAARLVINRLQVGTILGRDVQEVLEEFDIPLFKTSVRQRQVYARAVLEGCSVFQMGRNGQAAQNEIRDLAQEITGVLNGKA